jgi:alanine dehydrogenase
MAIEPTLLLSARDVQRCVGIGEALETTEASLRDHANGKVVLPTKVTLDMSGLGIPNWINAMPAYVAGSKMAGLKWIGGFARDASAERLPFILGLVVLTDPHTGVPAAIMDGAYITTLRTGAAAAIAAKYLARKDASIVALLGAGVQGRSALLALSRLFRLTEVRIADITEAARVHLAAEMEKALGIRMLATDNCRKAVGEADIVVTATTADAPLVDDAWIGAGALVVSLGSYQELDTELVLRADKLVVDHREQSRHRGQLVKMYEAGLIDDEAVFAQLGEIVAGQKPGREDESERIVACLTGMALEDIALAAKAYARAKELGLGVGFNFLDGV